MVIVLILGGGSGWVVHGARVQRDVVMVIERAGGRVDYDGDFSTEGHVEQPKPFWLQWIAERLGREYFETVTGVEALRDVSDAEMAQIGRLDHLVELKVLTNKVTDAGIAHIRGLSRLKSLEFGPVNVTSAALANLEGLSGLTALNLIHFPTTDDDLTHLSGLTRLQWL